MGGIVKHKLQEFAVMKNANQLHIRYKWKVKFPKLFTGILRAAIHQITYVKDISRYVPGHRIQTLLQRFKFISPLNAEKFEVDLLKQHIADVTDLRIETVIRCIKKIQEKGLLNIQKGKIYF